jgi:hypothetical protein
VDGRSDESYAEDDRPIGARPYVDRSTGSALPRRIPRSRDPRIAPRHGNVYQFPSEPRTERAATIAATVDPAALGQLPGWTEAGADPETTDTMDLSGGGLASSNTQQRSTPAPDIPRQPGGIDDKPRPRRHARPTLREPGTIDRRRRLSLQATYVVALGLCSYLLLGGLGIVALPFDPASLIPGSNSPGSDQPATPPGPADTFTEPSAGSLTEQPEPLSTPTTSAPFASSSVPTPTSPAPSTPTVGSTPSATASPTPTPTKHNPTPPGQTRKPTKPPRP